MPFEYQNNQLYLLQGSKKSNLTKFAQKQGTPFYLYDIRGMVERLKFFQKHSPPGGVHYAMKANAHPEILEAFRQNGAGVDVVSGGEIKLALKQGFKGSQIIFSGVGKTEEEIKLALEQDILQFNVESLSELKRLAKLAKQMNKKARVAFRINPDVEFETHPYIKTGLKEHKFGLEPALLPRLKQVLQANPLLTFYGLTMHIGSQIQDLGALKQACLKIKTLYQQEEGLQTLDVGGGLGIDYKGSDFNHETRRIQEYGLFLKGLAQDTKARILTEPGRILTAQFGLLVAQVQYIKKTSFKNFAVLDTGMHHLMRPCLYQAYHRIVPLEKRSMGKKLIYDIVGPICESSDILGRDRSLTGLKEGDFVAILDTGAYGASMANQYNAHNLPTELAFH